MNKCFLIGFIAGVPGVFVLMTHLFGYNTVFAALFGIAMLFVFSFCVLTETKIKKVDA